MLPKRVTLIITTYNWPEALDLVLASVQRQSRAPDQVVIGDDGSDARTEAVVDRWRARLRPELVHVWQEDQGFRAGRVRNLAMAASTGDYLVSIDGDMLLHERFVEDHVAVARAGRFVQGVRIRLNPAGTAHAFTRGTGRITTLAPGLERRGKAMRSRLLSVIRSRTAPPMEAFQSCNQAYWMDDLVAVNGYDERFTSWGYEDTELSVRLIHRGVRAYALRHRGIAYHLDHLERPRTRQNPNYALLQETLDARRQRCQLGLDGHLRAAAPT